MQRRKLGEILVAFIDPLDKAAIAAAKQACNADIRPAIAPPPRASARPSSRPGADSPPAIRPPCGKTRWWASSTASILVSVEANASDIHIEPLKDRLRVRFLQDSILMKHKDLPRELIPSLTSRINDPRMSIATAEKPVE